MGLKVLLERLKENEEDLYKANYLTLLQDWIMNGEVNTQLDLQGGFVSLKEYETVRFFKQKPKEPSIANAHFVLDKVDQWVQLRSEERRVGKEGSSLWSALHHKKQKNRRLEIVK